MRKIPYALIFLFILGLVFAPKFFHLNSLIALDENNEIKELNKEIQTKKDQTKKIQSKQEYYTKAIQQKQEEKASLDNQLSILDNRLAKFELDIESTETEIDRANLEIRKNDIEIDEKNKEIIKEKEQIAAALKLINKQDMASTLEIILLNDSFSDFLNQVKYLEDLNKEIGLSLDSLKIHKEELEKNKASLAEKQKELAQLKEKLEEDRKILEEEKTNKSFVLDQTKQSEKEFQRLLAAAKQEQLQAANEISGLERAVREKMAKMSEKKLEFNDSGLIWPVPKNKITAYFHDPEYPFKYVFEHPAVDIRAGQGTPLKAAASGYVAKAKDAGKGYSYIMLIHGDGLSTVYGHVSKIYVKEDEYVVQGQTIGLSGGLPGTNGAGRMTTGPHLHFEVRSNGIPVNPLEYLP